MAEEDGEREKRAFQKQLERAVTVRLQHFKDQADSLTLESVRRLLEKDLGLENLALDAHKRFIRQYLEKIMDGSDESNPDPTTTNMDEGMVLSKEEETTLPKQPEAKSDKKSSTGNEETMEDSPIMGVLTPKPEVGSQSSLSESTIKKAILERADHLQANSDKISLAGVRRLLEEDLGLDKNTLDAFKIFISQQVDQVLSGAKNVKSVKKKGSEDVKSRKLKVSSEENSDNSESGSDEMKDKLKSRKEAAPRRTIKKLEQPKKRKISANDDVDVSLKKHNKLAKRQKEEDNNSDKDGSLSEDGQSQSSVERPAPKREKSATLAKSAPAYGKQVENLKSIIKACGMSVPPSIYKKAKQAPDDKRETTLVKELEGILLREGLSKNPTEKEIKDCRKRKDKARELEGIDMSNIISSSRRRSTFSFMAPEKPVVHAKKDKVDAKDSKKKESNNKDDNVGNKEKNEEKDEENDKEKEKDEAEGEEEKDKENEEEVEQEEEDDGEDEEEDDEDESEEFDEDDNEESD